MIWTLASFTCQFQKFVSDRDSKEIMLEGMEVLCPESEAEISKCFIEGSLLSN